MLITSAVTKGTGVCYTRLAKCVIRSTQRPSAGAGGRRWRWERSVSDPSAGMCPGSREVAHGKRHFV